MKKGLGSLQEGRFSKNRGISVLLFFSLFFFLLSAFLLSFFNTWTDETLIELSQFFPWLLLLSSDGVFGRMTAVWEQPSSLVRRSLFMPGLLGGGKNFKKWWRFQKGGSQYKGRIILLFPLCHLPQPISRKQDTYFTSLQWAGSLLLLMEGWRNRVIKPLPW